jgi:hypothetical protein|nr:MAG TPA: RimK-related lysine biosynthesis protein, Probable-dependent amine/thiol ligase family Amino-group [Caudoviricetes sp.]
MIVTLKKDDALKTLASSHHPYEGYKISISCIVTQIQREVKKGGLMYTCKKCKANVDAGELVGGVCDDCREETEKQESYFKQVLRIDVSGQFVMDFRKELVNA